MNLFKKSSPSRTNKPNDNSALRQLAQRSSVLLMLGLATGCGADEVDPTYQCAAESVTRSVRDTLSSLDSLCFDEQACKEIVPLVRTSLTEDMAGIMNQPQVPAEVAEGTFKGLRGPLTVGGVLDDDQSNKRLYFFDGLLARDQAFDEDLGTTKPKPPHVKVSLEKDGYFDKSVLLFTYPNDIEDVNILPDPNSGVFVFRSHGKFHVDYFCPVNGVATAIQYEEPFWHITANANGELLGGECGIDVMESDMTPDALDTLNGSVDALHNSINDVVEEVAPEGEDVFVAQCPE